MDTLQLILLVAAVLIVAGLGWWLATRRADRPAPAPPVEAPPSGRIRGRLAKTSQSLGGALRGVFGREALDQEFWDSMEEALISADVGVAAATDIVGRVRASGPEDPGHARRALQESLETELAGRSRRLQLGESKPAVVLIVGVNGSGKTTTVAKIAHRLREEGREPLLGAADTFRAAAEAQLRTWGERLEVDVVGGQEGADPAAVAFDAFQAAQSRGRDVVLVDTAGRLHSKQNLMAELAKIRRVLEKEASIAEVLLVLDATGGQNGITQAEVFTEAVGVTGAVLTKLDGTARGGVVVAVERALDIPVKFVGLGEGIDDMVPFDPHEFVEALLADA